MPVVKVILHVFLCQDSVTGFLIVREERMNSTVLAAEISSLSVALASVLTPGDSVMARWTAQIGDRSAVSHCVFDIYILLDLMRILLSAKLAD